jgi:SAM-dependent methyltransferase
MKSHRFIPKAQVVDRVEKILDLACDKNVLHIGMGGFVDDREVTARYISTDLTVSVHGRLAGVASSLTGLDINREMIESMQKTVPGDYVVADITESGLPEKLKRKFEVVLFPEVIEHLDCYRAALRNIRGLLTADGTLVITTVNAYCLESIIKMLFRYESVHEEHTSYFSYRTMKRLLAMNGFMIKQFSFTIERRTSFSSIFERVGYYTMLAATAVLPQYAEGLLFVARLDQ